MKITSYAIVGITALVLGVCLLVFGITLGRQNAFNDYYNLKSRCEGKTVLLDNKGKIDFKCTYK